jgi:hypothetical protein
MGAHLSAVSFERISNGIEAVRDRLLRAAACLKAAGVPYAVVGGNAVAAWVSRVDESAVRNTRDVDVLLRREDLPAATAALESAGFIHRRIASPGRAGQLDVFLDGPDARPRDAVHVVFAAEKTLADAPELTPDPVESEESSGFQLISLEALIRMKLTAWRDKDRMHLRDLLDIGLLDASHLSLLPPALRSRLQQIIDTPEG